MKSSVWTGFSMAIGALLGYQVLDIAHGIGQALLGNSCSHVEGTSFSRCKMGGHTVCYTRFGLFTESVWCGPEEVAVSKPDAGVDAGEPASVNYVTLPCGAKFQQWLWDAGQCEMVDMPECRTQRCHLRVGQSAAQIAADATAAPAPLPATDWKLHRGPCRIIGQRCYYMEEQY